MLESPLRYEPAHESLVLITAEQRSLISKPGQMLESPEPLLLAYTNYGQRVSHNNLDLAQLDTSAWMFKGNM